MPVLTTVKHHHTLWATIDRLEAHNAINFEVMDALEELLDQLEDDDSVRTFILSGSGPEAFISGGDLKEFHTVKSAKEAERMSRRMSDVLRRLEWLPCWTIACINGAAYGGGCEMMLAFDFRMAADSATFGFTQGKFYLPPGWGGLTRLVERVGRSTALKWLAETAVINAETARDAGLIDKTVAAHELEEKAWSRAEELSHNERDFIHALKSGALRLTKARWEAIEEEIEPFARFWEDDRHRRRVEEFLKRKQE